MILTKWYKTGVLGSRKLKGNFERNLKQFNDCKLNSVSYWEGFAFFTIRDTILFVALSSKHLKTLLIGAPALA